MEVIRRHLNNCRFGWIAATAVLAGCFLLLRIDLSDQVRYMDETIVLAVAQSMKELGRLDPNWAVAKSIHPAFLYPQYNFYSYNVVSYFWIEGAQRLGLTPIVTIRIVNLIYQALGILFIVLALARLHVAASSRLVVAGLLVVTPALVNAAHVARAESFVFMLLAGIIYATASRRLVIAGLLVGVSTACKLSLLSTALIIAGAVDWRGRGWSRPLRQIASVALAVGAGLALSAPYAVIHSDVLLAGVQMLNAVYHRPFPPHTLIDGGLASNTSRILTFFVICYGAMLPIALLSWRDLPPALVWLLLTGIGTLLYFLPVPMFVERNFDVAIVAMLIAAGVSIGARRRFVAALLGAMVVVPCLYWSSQIALSYPEGYNARRIAWEAVHLKGRPVAWFWTASDDIASKVPQCSGLIGVFDTNDDYSARLLKFMDRTGYRFVDRYHSRFSELPTTTLHTTLDTDMAYYECEKP